MDSQVEALIDRLSTDLKLAALLPTLGIKLTFGIVRCV